MTNMTLANNQMQQFMEGAQMMMRGWSMVCGSMADLMGQAPCEAKATGLPVAGTAPVKDEPKKVAKKEKAAVETVKSDAVAEPAADKAEPVKEAASVVEDDGVKPITRKDVQRAMGAKVKALVSKGEKPDAIGELFPQFGATCISELDPGKYADFLKALNEL